MKEAPLIPKLPILQANPKANYLVHKDEIAFAIEKVLSSGFYILGPEVKSFEREFAEYIGVKYAVGVGSGTDALYLSLRACGVGLDDIVLTVSHTAVATVAAIQMTGAIPFFVDIDSSTYLMDINILEESIKTLMSGSSGSRTRVKAIVAVHLYGHPVDMPSIIMIAQKYELYVIEDCAQAAGSSIDCRKTGTWGILSAFSFYPTKNMSGIGDGGMVATNDFRLAEKVQLLRQYGWRERNISEESGINSRLDELQAAVLRIKLKYLDQENFRRRQAAQIYNNELKNTPFILPQSSENFYHVYHQFVIRSKNRDEIRAYLHKQGVGTAIHYPVPVHLQPAFESRGPLLLPLSKTEDLAKQIFSLPLYPELTDDQLQIIARHLINGLKLSSTLVCKVQEKVYGI